MDAKEKRTLCAYYKRRFYRGRGVLARAVDFIALRLILFTAFYIWFSFDIESSAAAVLLSSASLAAICVLAELIKSIRLEKFIAKENARIAKKLFSQSLTLMPKAEFMRLVRAYISARPGEFAGSGLIYLSQTIADVDEEAVLAACRAAKRRGCKSVFIFSAAAAGQSALDIAARCDDIAISFIDAAKLAADAELPSEDTVREHILKQAAWRRRIKRGSMATALTRGRTARYVIVAAALFALSFFVQYTLYYRMLAGVCISLAALSFYAGHTVAAAPKDA